LVTLNLELCKLARTAECGPSICRCVPAAVRLRCRGVARGVATLPKVAPHRTVLNARGKQPRCQNFLMILLFGKQRKSDANILPSENLRGETLSRLFWSFRSDKVGSAQPPFFSHKFVFLQLSELVFRHHNLESPVGHE
jgi:hypothetical protein